MKDAGDQIAMAVMHTNTYSCNVCGKSFVGGMSQRTCNGCRDIKKAELRKEHFANLDLLSMEERLRKVEEWIYDYEPPISVNDIKF